MASEEGQQEQNHRSLRSSLIPASNEVSFNPAPAILPRTSKTLGMPLATALQLWPVLVSYHMILFMKCFYNFQSLL